MASNTVTRKTTYRVTPRTRYLVSAFTEDSIDGQVVGQGSHLVGTFDNEGQANLIAKSLGQYQPESETSSNIIIVGQRQQAVYYADNEEHADRVIAALRAENPDDEWRKARIIRE